MSVVQSLQNLIVLCVPAVVYVIVGRWGRRLSVSELTSRLGLVIGTRYAYIVASVAALLVGALSVSVASRVRGVHGLMMSPFVNAPPTAAIITSILAYGFIATGFPEELLFRGLIGGALFRRLRFWKANVLQSLLFTLPHLLLLVLAPEFWPLVVVVPFAQGLLMGWLRQISASIAPGVLVHAVSNCAGALWVLDWTQS